MSHLVINGVTLNTPGAWKIDRSLAQLLGAPSKRTELVAHPYVDGETAFDQYYRGSVFDLALKVQGSKDYSGASHSVYSEGLLKNALYLRTNIFSVKTPMAAALHLDGVTGSPLEADVLVENDVAADVGGVIVITFDLIVPSGWFV